MLRKKWNSAGLYSKRHALGRTSCGTSPTYSASKAREARHYLWHIRPRYHRPYMGFCSPIRGTDATVTRTVYSSRGKLNINLSGREWISYTATSWKARPQLGHYGWCGGTWDLFSIYVSHHLCGSLSLAKNLAHVMLCQHHPSVACGGIYQCQISYHLETSMRVAHPHNYRTLRVHFIIIQ